MVLPAGKIYLSLAIRALGVFTIVFVFFVSAGDYNGPVVAIFIVIAFEFGLYKGQMYNSLYLVEYQQLLRH